MRALGAEEFLRDVQHHVMTVKLDNGIYRHVHFQQPRTSNLWFDIVTWPGFLTIAGDMGTWTFSRVEDMFTFFRDETLRINEDYWAEKLQHGTFGGRDGAKVFDEDIFRARMVEMLDNYDFDDEDRAAVEQALHDDILSRDGKWDLMIAARDFRTKLPNRGDFYFDTCDLPTGMEYAYHFLWCLYAIVWGIQQYDVLKAHFTEVPA